MLGRRVLVVLFVPYVLWLVLAYRYHLVDGVNLAVHETGHLLFRPFGQTLHMLGGTIAQLFFPLACAVHFLRRGDRFAAAIMAIWLGESMMYWAEYLGDAQARLLPLVGGHLHDWHWLLSRAGLLEHCELLAALIHGTASVGVLGALAYAAWLVRPGLAVEDPFAGLDYDETFTDADRRAA